jgi:hypothetical protein
VIDLISVIETGIITSNEEELKISLGERYWPFKKSQEAIDIHNTHSKIKSLKELGSLFDDSHATYQAAICYAFASTFHDNEAYTLLIQLLEKNKASLHLNNFLNDQALIQLCQSKQDKLRQAESRAPPALKLAQRVKHDSNIQFNITIQSHFDAELKRLLAKIKNEMALAKKLDLMYDLLLKTTTLLEKPEPNENKKEQISALRHSASQFLQAVLDLHDEKQIPKLMGERATIKRHNPEFIPGMKPKISPLPMSFMPEKHSNTTQATWRLIPNLVAAKYDKKSFAEIENEMRNSAGTTKAISDEHNYSRIIIKNGKFYNESAAESFDQFDTLTYRSHGKKAFAAYTISTNGEILAFNHHNMYETSESYTQIASETIAPVYVAGEIQIHNGIFKRLTIHSGHYQPNIIHIYHTLDYFKNKGVDLSHGVIYLLDPIPAKYEITNTLDSSLENLPHTYKADELYTKLHEKIIKDLAIEKMVERKALITEVTATTVSKGKMQLVKHLNQACIEFPRLSQELQPLLQKASLIDPTRLGAAKQIAKLNSKIIPMIQEHLSEYIRSLSNMSAKYYPLGSQENYNLFHNLLEAINETKSDLKNTASIINKMKKCYITTLDESQKMNKHLKKHLNSLIIDLIDEIYNCLKKQKIVLNLLKRNHQRCSLHYIIDNLSTVQKQLNKVDTGELEAFAQLDRYADDIIGIVGQLKNAAGETGIEASVNSLFELTHLVTWWLAKLNIRPSIMTIQNDHIATKEPSLIPKIR